MHPLPPGLTAYRQTPEFTEETVPVALRRDHSTKAGVWGLIHVTAGALTYRIKATGEEQRLTPETPSGVVAPQELHSVEPDGNVSFYVEFWRQTIPPLTGAACSTTEAVPSCSANTKR